MLSIKELNTSLIFRALGFLLIIEGFFMWIALVWALIYQGPDREALFFSGLITSFIGFCMWFFTRKNQNRTAGKREGYVIVSTAWIVISLFGALPFIWSGAIPTYTDAFFETISGFTTTGASILTDIEAMPKGLLFWRSLTHWIGGMGIIVLSLAILPFLGIGGMQLFAAEAPGPTTDKLHPRITGTAKRLWLIYILLSLVETLLLWLSPEMDLFDALCHAFGTMATGGFSTKNASVAAFGPYVQWVIIIFMFLAGSNFTLHYLALHGRFRRILQNEEYRYYALLSIIAAIVISVGLILSSEREAQEVIRASFFQVISIITTTGFVTDNYLLWPGFLWFIIFLLMFTGGSAGSTGGGIKAIRQLLVIKSTSVEIKKLIHPRAFIAVKLNGKAVHQEIISNIIAFFVLYLLVFAGGCLVMSAMGLDYQSAVGSVIATLGNIGPGIGDVGPVENYSAMPVAGKWFLSFLMLLGRLELFTVIVILSPAFWRK